MSIISRFRVVPMLAPYAFVLTLPVNAVAESADLVVPAPLALAPDAPRASFAPEPEIGAPQNSSQATDERGPRTLFDARGHHAFGGFGGISVGYTRFAHTDASEICGEGAFLFDHAFSIGAAGCGIAARIDAQQYGNVAHSPGDRLEFGYGGLALRYHFFSTEIVNVSLGAVVGGGAATITNRQYEGGFTEPHAKTSDAVFVMEPRIAAFANLTHWARVGVFGGYRFVTGSDTANLSSTSLGGATAGATVHFGWL